MMMKVAISIDHNVPATIRSGGLKVKIIQKPITMKKEMPNIPTSAPAIADSLLLAIALTSPALTYQSVNSGRADYPAKYRGRVPLKVKVAKNVEPDLQMFDRILGIKPNTICLKDNEYFVRVNSHGAVSAILPNGELLGLLPSEFDVVEWHS